MADELTQENTDEEKMLHAIKMLKNGKPKFETARVAGYKTVSGLDQFAREISPLNTLYRYFVTHIT